MKKHTIFNSIFVIVLLALASLYVTATGYNGGMSHPVLFADTIRSQTSDTINIDDKLTVMGAKVCTVGDTECSTGSGASLSPSACPDGQVATGIDTSGNVVCSAPVSSPSTGGDGSCSNIGSVSGSSGQSSTFAIPSCANSPGGCRFKLDIKSGSYYSFTPADLLKKDTFYASVGRDAGIGAGSSGVVYNTGTWGTGTIMTATIDQNNAGCSLEFASANELRLRVVSESGECNLYACGGGSGSSSPSSCAQGEVATGIDSSGNVVCATPSSTGSSGSSIIISSCTDVVPGSESCDAKCAEVDSVCVSASKTQNIAASIFDNPNRVPLPSLCSSLGSDNCRCCK